MKVVLHMVSGDDLRLTDGGSHLMDDILGDIQQGRWVTVYRWIPGLLSLSDGLRTSPKVRINGALVEHITEETVE